MPDVEVLRIQGYNFDERSEEGVGGNSCDKGRWIEIGMMDIPRFSSNSQALGTHPKSRIYRVIFSDLLL